jgi:DNA-binding Lrp family transcriptional regulator
MSTIYQAVTPFGAFQAEWSDDEDSRVQYTGSAGAIAYFKDYLDLQSVSGAGGRLIRFDTLEPADFYGFCQSEQAGIRVTPTIDDLMDEMAETDRDAAPSDDDASDTELVFNLFIEGEPPEPVIEESEDVPGDADFLALASAGKVDFYDKAVIDRLAALAREHAAPDSAYSMLIMQAKTAAKNFMIAEFKKKTGR